MIVLLVHGIGAQAHGSLRRVWGVPLAARVVEISGVRPDVEEFNWHASVPVRSAWRVTGRLFFDLPWHLYLAMRLLLQQQARTESAVMRTLRCTGLAVVAGVVMSAQILLSVLNLTVVALSLGRRRLGRVLLSQVLGDAQLYLSGHESMHDVRRRLSARVDELLTPELDQVVVVAHSQGAAIAVDALAQLKRHDAERVVLVTVGGGHHLLTALSARPSALAHYGFRVWGCIFAGLGVFIWVTFQTTLPGLVLLTSWAMLARPADQEIGGLALDLLLQLGGLVCLAIGLWTLIGFLFAIGAVSERAGVATRASLPPCETVQLWSRFDPVTLGTARLAEPHAAPYPGQTDNGRHIEGHCSAQEPSRLVREVETWSLRHGRVLTEHVDYLRPGTSSLDVVALEVATAAGARTPHQPITPATGETWSRGTRLNVLLPRASAAVTAVVWLLTMTYAITTG